MSDPRALGRFIEGLSRKCLLGTLAAAMIASSAIPVFSTTASDAGRIASVSVLERGIYAAVDEGPAVVQGSLGPVARVAHVSLIKSTELIPARQMLRFGLRYVVEGPPLGSAINLRLVTRFPEAGLLDPANGIRHAVSEYSIAAKVGVMAYREFHFHQPWEIALGE